MIGLGVGIDYALFIMARYREHRAAGQDNPSALSNAMGSAGSAVLVAGGTVVVAMAALALTGLGFLASIGLSTSLVVLFAVATALTLLRPAVAARRPRRRRAGRGPPAPRHPCRGHGLVALCPPRVGPAVAVPGGRRGGAARLAAPALQMETGFPDAGDDPTSTTHRRAYDLLAEGFGPGFNAPLLLVADLRRSGVDAQAIGALAERIAADPASPRSASRGPPPPGTPWCCPRSLPRGRRDVRDPGARPWPAPANVAVSGLTAMTDDLTQQLSTPCPSSSPPSWPRRSCC